MEQSLKDFIRAFPKTETHLHIEGSLPWELLQKANLGKYLFLAKELGFTTAELSRVASNGFEVALVEYAGKRELLSGVLDVVGGS